jgi:hypothetical protein
MGALVAVATLVLASVALAQPADPPDPPLVNWTAPPYWTLKQATPQEGQPERGIDVQALGIEAGTMSLPSSPVPFVAIAPCRIVDTRQPISDGFHEPNFADGETRTYTFPNSTGCPGLPANSVAYSVNVQFRPMTVSAYITLYPAGTSLPLVSTTVGNPAGFVTDAAIVPAGTGGAIDVYCQYAGRVVIDINGYYVPENVVNTLNTKTGDVTLAPGSNVTITPSGNTLTIAATGGPGGVLPAGTTGQTLYNNGSAWTASSALTNDGTNVGVAGILSFPNTTGSAGQITFGGNRFIHDYGTGNTFVGQQAGNFSMTGSYNTANGYRSLQSNTTGSNNTTSGHTSLYANTTGSANTASGYYSLTSNTTGYYNTASGYSSLQSNTTGSSNTAIGTQAGANLTTGSYNIDIGNQGVAGEGHTIRIGDSNQTNTYIAGISGVTISSGSTVLIDSTGHLGSISSSIRFKQDVAAMGDASSRLMELRPVMFHYKTQPDGPPQYGLIAEEVEQVMPELVVRDATGQVETVAYHELPAMLLNELQKQQAQIVDQATTIQAQQSQIKSRDARIAALEAGSGTQQTQFADQARTIQAQLQTLTARLAALEKAMAATR